MSASDKHYQYATRANQARKILAILHDFLGDDLKTYTCLDIGCANGTISNFFAQYFDQIIGIDLDERLIRQARDPALQNSGLFAVASGFRLPFPDECFDILICAQVYEHVTDQPGLVEEVRRVLRRGGVCFFSGPNRMALVEEHYWLPLLSWFPRPLADLYMRIFRRGEAYDAYPLYYWQIKRLWQGFTIHDYSTRLVKEPQRFSMAGRMNKFGLLKRLPARLLQSLEIFFPNYNWVLVKPIE